MSEMKKMHEAINELCDNNGTHTTESLVSDMKKLNQAVSDLARRNTAMENILLNIAEKQKIPLSRL